MNDLLLGFVCGVFGGFCFGASWAIDRWIKQKPDALAEGIRSQIKRVRTQKQFVTDDYQVSSFATVETSEGIFEVIVRQPVSES